MRKDRPGLVHTPQIVKLLSHVLQLRLDGSQTLDLNILQEMKGEDNKSSLKMLLY